MGQSIETLIERESGSVYRDTDRERVGESIETLREIVGQSIETLIERENGSVYRDTDREREWVSLQRH